MDSHLIRVITDNNDFGINEIDINKDVGLIHSPY